MRLEEVDIAARDLAAALRAWAAASQLEPRGATSEGEARLAVGDIDLVLGAAGPGEDEGMRSLTLAVADLDAFAARLWDLGVPLEGATVGPDGRRGVMISPASAFGVPIRVVEEGQ
jgi:hypothetical protein